MKKNLLIIKSGRNVLTKLVKAANKIKMELAYQDYRFVHKVVSFSQTWICFLVLHFKDILKVRYEF